MGGCADNDRYDDVGLRRLPNDGAHNCLDRVVSGQEAPKHQSNPAGLGSIHMVFLANVPNEPLRFPVRGCGGLGPCHPNR